MPERKIIWIRAVDHQLLRVERKRFMEVLDNSPLAQDYHFIITDKFLELMSREEILEALAQMREKRGKLPFKYRIRKLLGLT